ncbi:hypothetical protein IF650_02540 [Cellulosimicrobium terreum]|nr:hypothetical protein [Cellulosimicrobium terreum]
MAPGMYGADVAQLRALALDVERAADTMTSLTATLSSLVSSSAWHGRDGDEFRGAWDGQCVPLLRSCSATLSDGAQALRRNADQQEGTSTDPGGAPGHGGSGGGGGGGGGGPFGMAVPPMGPLPFGPGGPGGHAGDPGDEPGVPGGDPYVVGPPTRPDIEWDDDFVYDSADPAPSDYRDWLEWKAKAEATRVHPGLQDAGEFYRHYLDNSGDPMTFDYERAYADDPGVAANVDAEIARTQQGVEDLIAAGNTDFSVTGDPTVTSAYPQTENWQKTIGGVQQWSSADVVVDGDQVTMQVTVHAEDYYNFNRGQADIASGTPDDVNGRFTELGWAQPFESSGTVERTVTWTLGDPGSATVTGAPEGR